MGDTTKELEEMTARIFLSRRNFCEEGCSMKITEDVRRYAAEKGIDEAAGIERGLQEKATEFQEAGAEIYAKT